MNATKVLIAMAALSCFAIAQAGTQAQSQTNAGASANGSVSAGQTGAQAQTQASGSASQNAATRQTNASGAGQANPSAGSANTSLQEGTTIDAVLSKPIDAKKAKEGDEVIAKTTHPVKGEGERTIPKGAKLIGHVTKASARAKGDSESSLGIMFDRAEIGKGREVPVHAVIQALAAARSSASADMGDVGNEPMGTPSYSGGGAPNGGSGGGLIGGTVSGVGNTVGNTAGQVGQTGGNVGSAAEGTVNRTAGGVGAAATSTLSAQSQGAIGLPGYMLQAATAGSTQGSIVTSSGKDVKLDSGTQMVLRVVSE